MKNPRPRPLASLAVVTVALFAATSFAGSGRSGAIDLFPWRADPLWGNRAALDPSPVGGATATSWQDSSAIRSPRWKDGPIAYVALDPRGDERGGAGVDTERFRINEDGRIDGSELLAASRPAEASLFERLMAGSGALKPGASAEGLYREYLGQLVDQGMAMLTMSRILDHEAAKKKLLPRPPEETVRYVMFSILIQNAIDLGAWRGTSPGQDALYALLKRTVGENPVRFNIDWTFSEHLEWERRRLCGRDQLEYPELALTFAKLPATVREFRDELAKQLLPAHRQAARQAIWQALLAGKFPELSDPVLGGMVSSPDLDRAYGVLRDTAFRVQPMTARVSDVVVSGVKAGEFRAALAAALSERSARVSEELFGNGGAAAPATESEQAATRARIVELRETVPAEILRDLRVRFRTDLSAGRLSVSLASREIPYNGTDDLSDPPPAGRPVAPVAEESFTSKTHCEGYVSPAEEPVRESRGKGRCESAARIGLQQKRAAINPIFTGSGIFPKTEHVDCDGRIHIMLVRELVEESPRYLPPGDRRVEPLLRAKLLSVRQGVYARELAYGLYKRNPLRWDQQTCTDEAWPCGAGGRGAARRFAELLFLETPYPKALICGRLSGDERRRCEQSPTGLGMDGPDRPLTSTLGRPDLFDRVMELDASALTRAIQLPNDHAGPRH